MQNPRLPVRGAGLLIQSEYCCEVASSRLVRCFRVGIHRTLAGSASRVGPTFAKGCQLGRVDQGRHLGRFGHGGFYCRLGGWSFPAL